MSRPTAAPKAHEPSPLSRLDLTRPVGGQIFGRIKRAILQMELPPGRQLSEAEIGASLGASRTPVREAMAALRDAGLVSTYASRGTFVTRLNAHRIREAQFLREALELANVRKLAEGGLSDPAREGLDRVLEQQRSAVLANDGARFQELDDGFHLGLAAATGYPRAARVLEREKMQLDRLRALSLRNAAHVAALLGEHEAIFAAIMAGEPDRAAAATRRHLRSILGVLEDMAARHAEYFEDGEGLEA